MKSLKILTVAALASLFAISSSADLELSGDGRYRLGITTDAAGNDTNYRNGRLRMTIQAGNANAGIQARLRTNIGDSDSVSTVFTTATATTEFTLADASTTDTVVVGGTTAETASVYIDRRNAFFKVGGLTVTMGEQGKYAGILGTYYGGGEFTSVGTVSVFAGNPATFAGWVSHETGQVGANAVLKSDFIHYGLMGGFQGINFNYTARPSNLARGNPDSALSNWGTAEFQDLSVSGTFGGATVELNNSNSAAENSNALFARVTVPVSGLNIRLGYAKMGGGFTNQDGAALLGEGIFNAARGHSQDQISGSNNTTDANTYTGVAVAGSLGNINYQVTAGSYDDSVTTTSDGFYAVDASYSLDSSTTLRFGMGRAIGKRGMGLEVNYAF